MRLIACAFARCESAIEYDSYDVQELNDEFATRCGLYGVLH